MAEKRKPKSSVQPTNADINVRGNVEKSVLIDGNNNVVHYYAANGEKREMRTGWFFGHRYGDLDSFTGRAAEMDMLNAWLNNDKDNLLMLRALGGFGKSALAWTWFNRVDREQWQTAVWWSFYEKESGFESFLAETLKHLGVEVKESARQQVNDLLEAMRGTNILIVLDGFERLLRQYGRMDAALQSDDEDADIDPSQRDCSSPLTETFLRGLSGAGTRSKVLMTTRLCPRALESADGKLLKGCREEPLSAFSPDDAVTYFHNEGIAATRAEILAACSAYGYHPLSLSLLVGLINEDHEHRGDIAAVKNLEIFADVRARRHHVLESAYESLAPERRDLLSKISCFRGSMEYAVLKKVFSSSDLDKALLDLRKRGLLQYAGETQRYDMHPIVRHYAYDRLTSPDRVAAHTHLRDYFAAVDVPTKPQTFDELSPVIELYYHTVYAGGYDEAFEMYNQRLRNPLYYRFGAYDLDSQLLQAIPRSDNGIPNLSSPINQSWNLYYETLCCERLGRLQLGLTLVKKVIDLDRIVNYQHNLGAAQGTLAIISCDIGDLKTANASIIESVKIFDNIDDSNWRGISHRGYGRILTVCGMFEKAEKELGIARSAYTPKIKFGHGLSVLSLYEGQLRLWQNNPEEAFECAKQARELSAQNYLRENVFADWLAGISLMEMFSSSNQKISKTEIENFLATALSRCRQINLIELEPDILLAWARWYNIRGDTEAAIIYAKESLEAANRFGYRLKQADITIFLAQYFLKQDKLKAKQYAEKAKILAECDGPPYYYKTTYEEAERILENLG
jgi:tetratricopeptide (TPR) repeat protein